MAATFTLTEKRLGYQARVEKAQICRHCRDFIEPILDEWGYDSHKGMRYGWHHFAATEESTDGRYVSECADGQNEAEPILCDACEQFPEGCSCPDDATLLLISMQDVNQRYA